MKCLKNLFKKPEQKITWGIIIPHTQEKPGASGFKPNGRETTEYKYALEMASSVYDIPYNTRDLDGVFGAVKRLGVNATIEPHCNAFNGKIKGCEFLVLKDDKLSEHYARMFIDAFTEMFPDRKLRASGGIKFVAKGDRGYQNLIDSKKAGSKIAILSECFFIDNPDDYISSDKMALFWQSVLLNEN